MFTSAAFSQQTKMSHDAATGIIEMVMDHFTDESEGTFTVQIQDGRAKAQSSLVLIGDGESQHRSRVSAALILRYCAPLLNSTHWPLIVPALFFFSSLQGSAGWGRIPKEGVHSCQRRYCTHPVDIAVEINFREWNTTCGFVVHSWYYFLRFTNKLWIIHKNLLLFPWWKK